ncbi:MAG: hypothetical protein PVJ57_08700 [Phycisphaerae bacterium]|jgi:hypothetical protein
MSRGDATADGPRGRVEAPLPAALPPGRRRRAFLVNILWWASCALSICTLCLWLASGFLRMAACAGPVRATLSGGELYLESQADWSTPRNWSAERFYLTAEAAPHAPVSIWSDFVESYAGPTSLQYVKRPTYCWLYVPMSLVWALVSLSAGGFWSLRRRNRRLARRAAAGGEPAPSPAKEKTHRFYLLIALLAVAAFVPTVTRFFTAPGVIRPWPEGLILTAQLLLCGWFAAAGSTLLTWATTGPGMVVPYVVYVGAHLRLVSARVCAILILIWTAAVNLTLGWSLGSSAWTLVAQGSMPLRTATVILCLKASFRWAGALVPLVLLALLLKRAMARRRGQQLPAARAEGFLPATGAVLIASAVSYVLLTSGLWDICDAAAGWGETWSYNRISLMAG